MMRSAPAFIALLLALPVAQACDLDAITRRLEEPLGELRVVEREVRDVQSTEGGVWQIYREKDGRVHTILRIDAGESGRNELRFSAASRRDYGIVETRFDYNRHAFVDIDSPFAVVRKTAVYYFFCGGKLYLPRAGIAHLPEGYEAGGRAAKAQILEAGEIADFTPGFAR
jgi:hypothetical protein